MLNSNIPWKHGFLMFSGGIEMTHWLEMVNGHFET